MPVLTETATEFPRASRYLSAATKEKTTDIDIVRFEQDILDLAMEDFKYKIAEYDALKKGIIEPERCEKCEYCKRTKKLTEPTSSEEYYLR